MSVLQTVQNDFNMGETIVRGFIKNYLSLSVFDMLGVSDNINSMPNVVARNLTRGFAFYLSDEVNEDIMTGNSNLREMNVKVLIDDTLFDAMKSLVIENVGSGVSQSIKGVIPQQSTFNPDRISSAVLLSAADFVGKKLDANHPLKRLSSIVGL